jgi:hypothetical protein
MQKYYKASEAIKKLGIPRSTFFVLVRTGAIPKVVLPLKKQALYPKEEIDKLATARDKLLEIEQEPERLKFMIAARKELEQIIEIDQMIFPQETWMTIEELQERQPYNPEITHVLKDEKTNTVLGYVSMSPMKPDILEKLITLEIDETSIKPDSYLSYTTDTLQDCYIISIAARPGTAGRYYAGKMLQACTNYLLELLEQGIIFQHLYTIATTEDGVRIAQHLNFMPLATETEWKSKYESFRCPYVLDLEDKESKSNFVKEYQRRLTNRNRRKKRYTK